MRVLLLFVCFVFVVAATVRASAPPNILFLLTDVRKALAKALAKIA